MAIEITRPTLPYVDAKTLNDIVDVMLANDRKLLHDSSISPKVWRCRWFNEVPIRQTDKFDRYYKKGEAVWLNTENPDIFVQQNYNDILSEVEGSSSLKYQYADIVGNQEKTLEFFKKIVTGELVGNSGLPLYYLGNPTANTRIRVSARDYNDTLPTDNTAWYDFFEDKSATARSEISACAVQLCKDYMDKHLIEYHLSGSADAWFDKDTNIQYGIDDKCLHTSLSNVANVQRYVNTRSLVVNTGFDWVVKYFHKKFNSGNTCKWFRVWNSGLVEQGGIVCAIETSANAMGDSIIKNDTGTDVMYKVKLNWSADASMTAPSYRYGTSAGGFYLYDRDIDFGSEIGKVQLDDVGRAINADNRYTVQLTPHVSANGIPYSVMSPSAGARSGYYYTTKEVLNMKNDSFCFILTPGCDTYSYHVIGFASNSQQEYK